MKHIRKKTVIFLLVFLSLYIVYDFYGSHRDQRQLEEETKSHLEKSGYNIEEDVDSISAYLRTLEGKEYMVAVIFTDEPDTVYFYSRKRDPYGIEQIGMDFRGEGEINNSYKHKEY